MFVDAEKYVAISGLSEGIVVLSVAKEASSARE